MCLPWSEFMSMKINGPWLGEEPMDVDDPWSAEGEPMDVDDCCWSAEEPMEVDDSWSLKEPMEVDDPRSPKEPMEVDGFWSPVEPMEIVYTRSIGTLIKGDSAQYDAGRLAASVISFGPILSSMIKPATFVVRPR